MARVYLSIGSNQQRYHHITSAVTELRQRFSNLIVSTVYESTAVGFEGDNFLNLVVGFDTPLALETVYQQLRQMEDEHGRKRGEEKFSSRTLDLDILTWGDRVGIHSDIKLPRDEIHRYAFVLKPLAEIAPDQCYPGSQDRYADLWQQFDPSDQKLWAVEVNW